MPNITSYSHKDLDFSKLSSDDIISIRKQRQEKIGENIGELTFTEIIDVYLKSEFVENENTRRAKELDLEKFNIFLISRGIKKPKHISIYAPIEIKDLFLIPFLDECLKQGLDPNSVRRYQYSISAFWKYLKLYVPYLPDLPSLAKVKRFNPVYEQAKTEYLNREEFKAFFRALKQHKNGLLYEALILSQFYLGGRRIAELLNKIEWGKNINLKTNRYKIPVLKKRNRVIYATGNIRDTLKEVLVKYKKTLPKEQKEVFILNPRTYYETLERYAKKAGIEKKISSHSLRTSFATLSIADKIHIIKIARAMRLGVKMIAFYDKILDGNAVEEIQSI